MASKQEYGIPYTPLPSSQPSQTVILLTPYRRNRRPSFIRNLRCSLLFTAAILLLSAAVYFLYPSDPDINVSRIQLNHIRVLDSLKPALDLSFSLTIKVRNRDFFSLDYDSLVVSIGYRGRELGFVKSQGGHLRARDSSYVNATLELDGLEVVHDVIYLIGDLAKGVIPFDTIAHVKGDLGVLLFQIPIQGKVSCEVYVNVNNQKVTHQDCHPQEKDRYSAFSSSTVAIDSELKGNEDLVWEPVSDKKSQVSCVWVARLKYNTTQPCFRSEYEVKFSLWRTRGIVSSKGCNFSLLMSLHSQCIFMTRVVPMKGNKFYGI